MRIGWSGWSIEVEEGWNETDHPECLTLEYSDEGSFQLSSATKTAGAVTLEDIDSLKEDDWGEAAFVQRGEFDGFVFRYVEGGHCWARWHLRNKSILLFATYNGSAEALKNEFDAVDSMLNTLRSEHKNA